jgi:hypothetical protein
VRDFQYEWIGLERGQMYAFHIVVEWQVTELKNCTEYREKKAWGKNVRSVGESAGWKVVSAPGPVA